MNNILYLLPVFVFLLLMLFISMYINRSSVKGKGFVKDYFIGGRSLGGFVLAMTTVATYSSVSSFVGGPGQAWDIGFGWIYMSVVQVTAIFLVMGILGKKISIVSRKIDAVTIMDVIRHRYESDLLADLAAIIIVLFFCATMVAQFVGGAKIFEAVTGYSYVTGLVLFGLIVVLYTTIGGFRGVVITDTLCAIMMVLGMGVLLYGVIHKGGGYTQIMDNLAQSQPQMLEPFSGGNMPMTLYISQWMLVGIFTVGLPQSAVRCMSYKDTKSLHRAMIIGTVVIGAMNIGMNLIGVLSKGILTGPVSDYGGSIDNIMPTAIVQSLSPLLAGITVIGPIAATISTVSSLLLTATSSIVKDIYLRRIEKKKRELGSRSVRILSQTCTLVIGLAIFVISIKPPDVIWKINMFAFGGLESAFFWVLVLGLFWKRANKTGGFLCMAGGAAAYCVSMAMGITVLGIHQILIGIGLSLVLMILGSFKGKHTSKEVLDLYFIE